jgi:hypothetical protein
MNLLQMNPDIGDGKNWNLTAETRKPREEGENLHLALSFLPLL